MEQYTIIDNEYKEEGEVAVTDGDNTLLYRTLPVNVPPEPGTRYTVIFVGADEVVVYEGRMVAWRPIGIDDWESML